VSKVKIEVMPWITTECGYEKQGNLMIEEEFKGGDTIGEVLRRISTTNLRLAECLFDPTTQGIHGYISIILNNRLISQLRAPGVILKDGDVIRLLPTIEGG
jgi:molybdopterin converting factor small subunit